MPGPMPGPWPVPEQSRGGVAPPEQAQSIVIAPLQGRYFYLNSVTDSVIFQVYKFTLPVLKPPEFSAFESLYPAIVNT